jgi:hypothetical protein
MLALEDASVRKFHVLQRVLNGLTIFFTVMFALEAVLKLLGLGVKAYFSSGWNILDFVIVLIAILSLTLSGSNLSALRSLRTLRALRPLRVISRIEGMKVVVSSLLRAIPGNQQRAPRLRPLLAHLQHHGRRVLWRQVLALRGPERNRLPHRYR